MARQRDTTEVNLNATKGTLLFFTLQAQFFPFWHSFLSLSTEHLAQVKSDRNIANSRVTELEERIATLEKEADAAKKEAVAATQRAETAE